MVLVPVNRRQKGSHLWPSAQATSSLSFVIQERNLSDARVLDSLVPQIAARGEFSVTRFEADELILWLKTLGFLHVSHLSPGLAEQRYSVGRRDLPVCGTSEPIRATE